MTPLGWGALAVGGAALVALALVLRRLSRVEPDFSPLAVPAPSDAPAAPKEE